MNATSENIGISEQVLNWINSHGSNLQEVTTKQVAENFNLSQYTAYRLCCILADKKLIAKFEPGNGRKLDCYSWTRKLPKNDN